MLTLDNLSIEYGGRFLLQDVSYQFKSGDITGLIGRNGAGKSSLLRVIVGKNSPSGGRVSMPKDTKIGYFHQDLLSYETDLSIFELAREAFAEQYRKQARIDEILHALEQGSEDMDLWDELAVLQSEWDTLGGDALDARVYEILAGLGFKAKDFDQPFHTFSGGWRMRVLLAKMLLESPDILLLDEPTNHLDLPSIEWLENYLNSYSGVCIIVSHDRYFLDRMVNTTVEVSQKTLIAYAGNYSFYLEDRVLRRELLQRSYENQQKYIADQERFIERFKAKASKATQAQSKLKQLNKIERIDAPDEESFDLNIRFTVKTPSGREVLSLKDITKNYGTKEVLKGGTVTIERGDKIALIGANGIGKSTMLRIIADMEPSGATRKLGHNVQQALFAQHQLEALTLKNTILQEVVQMGTDKTEPQLRNILGGFMFSGDDVDKKIQVLSGGEKSRVALAKVLLSEANFLLLDEPTNHLDMNSIGVLIQSLQNYEGTYVVISHDRHFLHQVANKIWYIEDGILKEYPGNFEEYNYWKAQQAEAEVENKPKEKAKPEPVKVVAPVAKVEVPAEPVDFEAQKQRKNRIRKLEREQEEIEAKISTLEKKKEELLKQIAAAASDYAKLASLQQDLGNMEKEIDTATRQWESVLIEIEEMA